MSSAISRSPSHSAFSAPLPETLDDLKQLDLIGLESLYATAPCGPLPQGIFRGLTLLRLATPGAHEPFNRLLQGLLFELTPWGIDFDTRTWFFFRPRWRAGHFSAVRGRSRWRATEVLALHYHVSRLPRPVRDLLYDEVKPLSPNLCLGLGGTNRPRGAGDHFFFALSR